MTAPRPCEALDEIVESFLFEAFCAEDQASLAILSKEMLAKIVALTPSAPDAREAVDTARLDWLDKDMSLHYESHDTYTWTRWTAPGRNAQGRSLREVIDAMRAATPPAHGETR